MLKTSPVLTNSANASPTNFRRGHAPSRSPQAQPASRHSTSEAATLSAMPGSTSMAQCRSSGTSSERNAVSNPPRRPHTNPGDAAADGPVQHGNMTAPQHIYQHTTSPHPQNVVTPAASGSLPSGAAGNDAQKVSSPNKRRVSPPPHAGGASSQHGQHNGEATSPATTGTVAPKRAKTDGEPKILPHRYELCAVEDIVELIAHMLAELIATNDAIRVSSGGLTRFHSRTAPGISVRDYLHRLARHATLTPPLLLSMVYYIDRLCALYPEFTINTLTVHRFLITAATVAAKGLSDSFWNNTTYARVGGVRVAELKLLELEFLYRVDWKIVPNPEVLVAYYRGLVERTPQYALEIDGSSNDSSVHDDDSIGEEEEPEEAGRRQLKEEEQSA